MYDPGMERVDHRDTTDPAINLALEEYCVRNVARDGPLLLLYGNDPCVVIGKNQNPLQEVDVVAARERGIPVVRRISGGGTVYHDPGNLNFSFHRPYRSGSPLRFRDFADPVAEALRSIGVPATIDERNDIRVGGLKVSGNAQFTTVTGALGHGTLLFDADLDALRRLLRPRELEIRSRAVGSVRSEVGNLREYLGPEWTIESFRDALAAQLGATALRELPGAAWDEIRALADRRYRSWDWNVGRTPPFTAVVDLGDGPVEIDVRNGRVEGVRGEAGRARAVAWIEERLGGPGRPDQTPATT